MLAGGPWTQHSKHSRLSYPMQPKHSDKQFVQQCQGPAPWPTCTPKWPACTPERPLMTITCCPKVHWGAECLFIERLLGGAQNNWHGGPHRTERLMCHCSLRAGNTQDQTFESQPDMWVITKPSFLFTHVQAIVVASLSSLIHLLCLY